MNKLHTPDMFSSTGNGTRRDIGEPFFTLTVPGRLPSWNAILAMEQWQRYKFKKELARTFMSELRRSAADYSTKTTCAKNIWSIYADTLASFLMTAQQRRESRSAKRKLNREPRKKSGSKSGGSEKVPF